MTPLPPNPFNPEAEPVTVQEALRKTRLAAEQNPAHKTFAVDLEVQDDGFHWLLPITLDNHDRDYNPGRLYLLHHGRIVAVVNPEKRRP